MEKRASEKDRGSDGEKWGRQGGKKHLFRQLHIQHQALTRYGTDEGVALWRLNERSQAEMKGGKG
ncbi:hypothetical protein JOB18_020641 [Solea senegalensis]|uniref:Uncharacterized protein n=1 Tax=Solea senegalensis TaxID=28829 RepID=A0AAV6RAR3_SOLSE|nr:hypothetical protein JOB18_020641 [Solea senegalensis]